MNMTPSLRNCRWEDPRGLNRHGMSPDQQEGTSFLEQAQHSQVSVGFGGSQRTF